MTVQTDGSSNACTAPNAESATSPQASSAAPQSHRVYWQQWLMTTTSSAGPELSSVAAGAGAATYLTGPGGAVATTTTALLHHHPSSPQRVVRRQRQLITSSAAVRITPNVAKAKDVTDLMRNTLNLTTTTSSSSTASHSDEIISKHNRQNDENYYDKNPAASQDSLVLVGTILVPDDDITFEHEQIIMYHQPQQTANEAPVGQGLECEDYVRHGHETKDPKKKKSSMSLSLEQHPPDHHLQRVLPHKPFHLVKTLNPEDDPIAVREEMMERLEKRLERLRRVYAKQSCFDTADVPKVQWFFIPGSASAGPSIIPNCIELDGYATTMDDEDGDVSVADEEDDDDCDGEKENDGLDASSTTTATTTMSTSCQMNNDENVGTDRPSKTDSILSSTQRQQSLSDPLLDDTFSQEFVRSQIMQSPLAQAVSSKRHPSSTSKKRTATTRRKEVHEWRRYLQISQSHDSNPNCLAGYLLKQSSKDRHVWRKVYCVLSEDYLWYMHALLHPNCLPVKEKSEHDNQSLGMTFETESTQLLREPSVEQSSRSDIEESIWMAPQHGRISLDRALLIESNAEFERSSLYRIPHSFQVVDGKGISHSFRASSEHMVHQWTRSLSVRLMDSYENLFLANAELIIAEESMARTHRWMNIAVKSAVSEAPRTTSYSSLERVQALDNGGENDYIDGIRKEHFRRRSLPTGTLLHDSMQSRILHLGLDIAQYREGCRHIQALLLSEGALLKDGVEISSASGISTTGKMVQELWREASELLGIALQIASNFHASAPSNNQHTKAAAQSRNNVTTTTKQHSSRSLQTVCRHVEFQITGQFGQSNVTVGHKSAGAKRISNLSHHVEPPPIDLFDKLLQELYASVQKK